jgi:hypothetical protein
MSGFDETNSGYNGVHNPHGVPNPTRKATSTSTSPFVYSRRYLDWNRYTFEFHAVGQLDDAAFDYHSGLRVSAEINNFRDILKLKVVYGCVPDFYCQTCVPFTDSKNAFTILSDALATVVVNPQRANIPRIIISNTGGIRFDLYKGPFTFDDNFIVSPFRDVFIYIPSVPWSTAQGLLAFLNGASGSGKKRGFAPMPLPHDFCVDPILAPASDIKRRGDREPRGISRRQITLTPGYTTTDDFGTDGQLYQTPSLGLRQLT